MTKKVILMCGLPGSGKSTYIKQKVMELEEDGFTVASISRDYHRKQLVGDTNDPSVYFSREKQVFQNFINDINECLATGIDYIFVDATHINAASRAKILRQLRPDPSTALDIMVIDAPVWVCKTRNRKRIGFARVPDSAIDNMYRNFQMPSFEEFEYNNYGFGGGIKITIRSGGL